MLKIFFELGEMDNVEANLLAEAANRLGVGEFQIFQLSYNEWHGNDLDEKLMERVFFEYLTADKVPPWARHYARRIIDQFDQDELQYNDPHYHRYDAKSMQTVSKTIGLLKIGAFALVMAILFGAAIVLLDDYTKDSEPCYFPPCIKIE